VTDLTSAGAVYLAQATINDSPQFFASGTIYCYLGTGNSSTAFSIGHTDNQGVLKERAQATVTRAAGVLTFVATFGTSVGNYEWLEVGVFNAASGGTMLCRKVQSPTLGTKNNTQVWVLTNTVTYTAT
jgi:hypothetical protein